MRVSIWAAMSRHTTGADACHSASRVLTEPIHEKRTEQGSNAEQKRVAREGRRGGGWHHF